MCQDHGFLVNHLARDCHTYKREIIDASKDKTKGSHPKKGKDGAKEDDKDSYPDIKGVMIISGGPHAYEDCHSEKVTRRLIFATTPAVPVYLRWSERPITFNRDDHHNHVIEAGRFPRVVSAVVGGIKMTKVFMDGGSGINILYKGAFANYVHRTSFHGIIPGQWVMPLGTITLSVTLGGQVHYRKKALSYEVIDFEGPYHAILARPGYAKFMAIPSYVYLKPKMLGPCGVITVMGSFQDAYECERLAIEQAQRDLILDEPHHANKDKQKAGSGTPR
jgi:hypothetical protein